MTSDLLRELAPTVLGAVVRRFGDFAAAEDAVQEALLAEATMAQRISRAKKQIKSSGVPFRMPTTSERGERLSAVLHALYLIFNEGYASSVGDALQRRDLANEAIRLTRAVHRLLRSGEQGKFWDMHDLLFANQSKLGSLQSASLGEQMGLDTGRMRTCLADEAAPRIRNDIQQAQSVGLASTPSFLIGRLVAGKLAVTSVVVGARPFEDFAGILDPLLKTSRTP